MRRFALAHELCHLLYDRAEGAPLAIASGPWAPRSIERRAGAFAAMSLLPPSLVEQTLGRLTQPVTTPEGVIELATRVRISRTAAIHHLLNMALLSETERDELLRRIQD